MTTMGTTTITTTATNPRRARLVAALLRIAPGLPRHEVEVVADHAQDSAGLSKAKLETAAWLSLVAYARHMYSDYDTLLADGYDHDSARHFALADMNEALGAWGVKKRVGVGE